jgi:hypothetical protein
MPLVNLTTNLKDLRYGNDRRDGGSSGQPYIKSPIPAGEGPGFGDYDFLLRGGSLLPGAIAQDVSRLTQMMTDLKSPNGLLFTVKQNALSRSGVNIKAQGKSSAIIGDPNRLALNNGIYLPTSTLLQAAVNPLGGHLLKQGINPFASTNTISQGNTLSTGFGGAFPLSNPLYLDTIAQNERQNNVNSSRLIQFLDNKINSNVGDQVNLYSYSGGPGSTLGIGKTNILMSKDRTGENNPFLAGDATNTANFFSTAVSFGYNDYSVFTRPSVNFQGAKIFNGKNVSAIYEDITGTDVLEFQYKTDNLDTGALRLFSTNVFQPGTFNPQAPENVLGLGTTMDYNQIQNAYSGSNQNLSNGGPNNVYNRSTILQDFRQRRTDNKGIISLDYTNEKRRIEGRVNLGDPGNKTIPRTRYTTGTGEALDKITALPLYRSKNIDPQKPINDLCKFRIGVIDNNDPSFKTYIHFRAFLDGMDDSYSADWQAQKFSGRAENLYNYQGFDRKIDLSWTVAAQSKEELMPMYRKLNYLASVCAPDYSDDGYMRGNLVELTVGGYLFNQVGIITGINYTVPMESPWEIAIGDEATATVNTISNALGSRDINQPIQADNTVKELPMIIKVSGFSFIPIHNFVPNLQVNGYGGGDSDDTGVATSYGEQRYIALSNKFYNNYDDFI